MKVSGADGLRKRRGMWGRAGWNLAAFAGIAVAALIVGGLTSPAQGFLPAEVSSLANSASGWTMLAFLLVWLSRLRPLMAAVAGIVAFVLMVDGYRIVSEWRGLGYGAPFHSMYTYLGVLVGPFVGAGAGLLRYGTSLWRVLSVGPLVVIMVGDGIYGLTVVRETTSPVYWWSVIIAGVGIAVVHLVKQRPRAGTALLFLGLTVGLVAVYFGGLQLLNWMALPSPLPLSGGTWEQSDNA